MGGPLPELAEAEALAQVEEKFDFQVVLDREDTNEKIGLTYKADPTTGHLVVSGVKPQGLAAEHNWTMRQFPRESALYQQQLTVGDRIVSVNGERNQDAKKRELLESLMVLLIVQRWPPS